MFELHDGWLFYGLDNKLYVVRRFDGNWEVFEARIEWWCTAYNDSYGYDMEDFD